MSSNDNCSLFIIDDHPHHDEKWQILVKDSQFIFCLPCAINIWNNSNESQYKKRYLVLTLIDILKTSDKLTYELINDDKNPDELINTATLLFSESLLKLINAKSEQISIIANQSLVIFMVQANNSDLNKLILNEIIANFDDNDANYYIDFIAKSIQVILDVVPLLFNTDIFAVLSYQFEKCSDESKLNILAIFTQVYKFKLSESDFFQLYETFHQKTIKIVLLSLESKNDKILINTLILANQLIQIENTILTFIHEHYFINALKMMLKSQQDDVRIGFAQLILKILNSSYQNKFSNILLKVGLLDLMFDCLSTNPSGLFVETLLCCTKLILESVDLIHTKSHPSYAAEAIINAFSLALKYNDENFCLVTISTLILLIKKYKNFKIMTDTLYFSTLHLIESIISKTSFFKTLFFNAFLNLFAELLSETQSPKPLPFERVMCIFEKIMDTFETNILIDVKLNKQIDDYEKIMEYLFILIEITKSLLNLLNKSASTNMDLDHYFPPMSHYDDIESQNLEICKNSSNLSLICDKFEKIIMPIISLINDKIKNSQMSEEIWFNNLNILASFCICVQQLLTDNDIQASSLLCKKFFSNGHVNFLHNFLFKNFNTNEEITKLFFSNLIQVLAEILTKIDNDTDFEIYNCGLCKIIDCNGDIEKLLSSSSSKDNSIFNAHLTFFKLNYYLLFYDDKFSLDERIDEWLEKYFKNNSCLGKLLEKEDAIKHLIFIIANIETTPDNICNLAILRFCEDYKENLNISNLITNHTSLLHWSFKTESRSKSIGKLVLKKFFNSKPDQVHLNNMEIFIKFIEFISINKYAKLSLNELIEEDSIIFILDKLFEFFEDEIFEASHNMTWHNFSEIICLILPDIMIKLIKNLDSELYRDMDINKVENQNQKEIEEKIRTMLNLTGKLRVSDKTYETSLKNKDEPLVYQLCECLGIYMEKSFLKAILQFLKIIIEYYTKEENQSILNIFINSSCFQEVIIYNIEDSELIEYVAFIISSLVKFNYRTNYNNYNNKDAREKIYLKFENINKWMTFSSKVVHNSMFKILNYSNIIDDLIIETSQDSLRKIIFCLQNVLCRNQDFNDKEVVDFFLKIIKKLNENSNTQLLQHMISQPWFHLVIEFNLQLNDNDIFKVEEELFNLIIIIYKQTKSKHLVNYSLIPITKSIAKQLVNYSGNFQEFPSNIRTKLSTLSNVIYHSDYKKSINWKGINIEKLRVKRLFNREEDLK